MRMLCCPWRVPRNGLSRFPGGIDSSRSSRTRFYWSNLRRAIGQTARGHTWRAAAVAAPLNTSSVPRSRKERITIYVITATDLTVKPDPVRLTVSRLFQPIPPADIVQGMHRAPHPQAAWVEHVGVDHDCLGILVAEEPGAGRG